MKIVLDRPNHLHKSNNHKSTANEVQDVCIDPYIGIHLRAHQIEGVKFLYKQLLENK